jgi:hypothetical protein
MATKTVEKAHDLRTAPIITLAALGRVFGVGPWMARTVAVRLGVEPQRLANGREFISFEQAETIARELSVH